MKPRRWMVGVIAIAPLLFQTAAAGEVYSWVDEDGVTHFSDTLPAGASEDDSEVETIAMLDEFTEADPAGHYYSIVNQWKRIQEERAEDRQLALQHEQLRLERMRIQQHREAAQAAAAREAEDDSHPVFVGTAHPGLSRHAFGHGSRGFTQRRQFGHRDFKPAFSRSRQHGHMQRGSRGGGRHRPEQHFVGNN